jgi:hypothetical protein
VVRQAPFDIRAPLGGRVPPTATLLLKDEHGATRTLSLTVQSDAQGKFLLHHIPQVDEPFSFQIRAGDAATPWVQVQPVDRPKLADVAVRVVWPEYTQRPPSTWNRLPSGAHVLRGSRFELEFSADQELELAALETARESKPERLPLQRVDARRYRYETDLQQSLHFQVIAENKFGMRNVPAECRIDVDEDQPPIVNILETSQQVALEPDETLRVEFEAKDDFGLKSAELVATVHKDGEKPRETIIPIDLGTAGGTASLKKSVALDLKQFALDAKTELSYAVRVRDNRGEATSAQMSNGAKEGKNANHGSE